MSIDTTVHPEIVDRASWEAARAGLLDAEKVATEASDRVARPAADSR